MTKLSPEEAILHALACGDKSGFKLAEVTAIPTAKLFPALLFLERAGKISSHWQMAGAKGAPRRRLYRLAETAQ